MGHVPPRGWLDELLESAVTLMHDFSAEVRNEQGGERGHAHA